MKKSKLETKVKRINTRFILSDNHGRYIPFCDLGYHRGLILTNDICQRRHCKHYYRLYISRENQR